MAAFAHSVSLGYRYLETDVHATRDGRIVAAHDPDLMRVAGVAGNIADLTWAEVQQVDVGDGERIPLLADLLTTFPEARFNVDAKADAAVEPLTKVIKDHDAVDRIGVGGFDDARIVALRERLGPALCTSPGPMELLAWLGSDPRPEQAFGDHGCLQIPPQFGQFELTSELLEAAHELGLQVHLWTINDPAEMVRLLDLGVDAIITDEVDLLRQLLVERDSWHAG